MAQQQFQEGDVVQLKSGGLPMTVEMWDEGLNQYTCVWFEKSKAHREYFSPVVLVKYERPKPTVARIVSLGSPHQR
jgi:uncharacterized protein YodC (DUF2158 family)